VWSWVQRFDLILRRFFKTLVTTVVVLIFNFTLSRIVSGVPVSMIVIPRMRPQKKVTWQSLTDWERYEM
jgi:ABC-type dipeptide/oligopeptide/nickel transport system permease component